MFIFVNNVVVLSLLLMDVLLKSRSVERMLCKQLKSSLLACSTLIFSFSLATNGMFILQGDRRELWIVVVVIAFMFGFFFAKRLRHSIPLFGGYQGAVGSLMGTMFAAVVLNPSLCSLPTDSIQHIERNSVIFGLFCTLLAFVTYAFIYVVISRIQKQRVM